MPFEVPLAIIGGSGSIRCPAALFWLVDCQDRIGFDQPPHDGALAYSLQQSERLDLGWLTDSGDGEEVLFEPRRRGGSFTVGLLYPVRVTRRDGRTWMHGSPGKAHGRVDATDSRNVRQAVNASLRSVAGAVVPVPPSGASRDFTHSRSEPCSIPGRIDNPAHGRATTHHDAVNLPCLIAVR